MPHSQTHAPLHSAYELVVLGKQTPAVVLERNVWTNYSSAQFSASPETNQILSATVLERLLLPCFGWLKGETGTADNRIFYIESRLMLNKIIKISFQMLRFVHPSFHQCFFRRNPSVKGVKFG